MGLLRPARHDRFSTDYPCSDAIPAGGSERRPVLPDPSPQCSVSIVHRRGGRMIRAGGRSGDKWLGSGRADSPPHPALATFFHGAEKARLRDHPPGHSRAGGYPSCSARRGCGWVAGSSPAMTVGGTEWRHALVVRQAHHEGYRWRGAPEDLMASFVEPRGPQPRPRANSPRRGAPRRYMALVKTFTKYQVPRISNTARPSNHSTIVRFTPCCPGGIFPASGYRSCPR